MRQETKSSGFLVEKCSFFVHVVIKLNIRLSGVHKGTDVRPLLVPKGVVAVRRNWFWHMGS